MVKFRTMNDARGPDGELLPDDQRLTSFGRFLRATSLDEFPEMWNVLIGDMSVVGPRPLLMRYVARYDAFQARRMEVKPGVTGWAQINGRNTLTWEEKFALDVWYVDHRTFWLDMKIVVKTFFKVLSRSDVSSERDNTSAKEFTGSPKPN
jgi:lipopolysaccharide/colanic/teichoic acid biosynthesis glycosyltransferase